MSRNGQPPESAPLDLLAREFCRLWLAGRAPRAPGTCGSAVAALLAPWCFLPLPLAARAGLLAALFVLGALAATRVERLLGRADPSEVVVDELVGQWIVYLPFATLSPLGLLAGFALFRVFDIAKPWPIRRSETWLPGGYGVMIDDVIAGGYALCCLLLLRALWPGL